MRRRWRGITDSSLPLASKKETHSSHTNKRVWLLFYSFGGHNMTSSYRIHGKRAGIRDVKCSMCSVLVSSKAAVEGVCVWCLYEAGMYARKKKSKKAVKVMV